MTELDQDAKLSRERPFYVLTTRPEWQRGKDHVPEAKESVLSVQANCSGLLSFEPAMLAADTV